MNAADLRLPARAWKVKLIGEGADDAGGVFDDTITEMCQELETGAVSLLIPTPNAVTEAGYNTDRSAVTSILVFKSSLMTYALPSQCDATAERRTRDREVPCSKPALITL